MKSLSILALGWNAALLINGGGELDTGWRIAIVAACLVVWAVTDH